MQSSLKVRDLLERSLDGTVNTFVGYEDAAKDPDFFALFANPSHKAGRIVDASVLVEDDNRSFHGGILAIFRQTDQSVEKMAEKNGELLQS